MFYIIVENNASSDELREDHDPFVGSLQEEEMQQNPKYTASRIGPTV